MYNCAFCGGASGLNKDVYPRVRDRESVISEIEEILAIYPDITSIRVLDDLFLRTPHSIDDANQIFATFPQLTWRGMVHALTLVHAIDKIEGLKKNGCKELFMGIESGSKKINKMGSVCDIIKVAKALLENGIDLKGYFIYGFPGETKQDFEETYQLAYGLKEISTHTPGVFRTVYSVHANPSARTKMFGFYNPISYSAETSPAPNHPLLYHTRSRSECSSRGQS